MTVSIFSPFPRFDDVDGQPLDGGFIYIGTANTDPFSNRISVFSDPAMSVALSQPLRTAGGFVVDGSGTPINVYCAADFSISVRNRLNVELYSAASYGFRIFADAITFSDLVVTNSILPDAAGGASNGSNALPWSTQVTRASSSKTLTVYDQAQPTVTADLAKANQRKQILCMGSQTSSAAFPTAATWVNGYNVNTGSSSNTGNGAYDIRFSVALPSAAYFVMMTTTSGASSADTWITVDSKTTSGFTVALRQGGTLTNYPFDFVVFGNPAVADPIS